MADQVRQQKINHLEIVQEIIKRQAQNSFLVKGWSITLVTVIFAVISAKEINPQLSMFGLFPAILFWYLDAKYLRLERMFRHLYDAIVKDIQLNTTNVNLFEINPYDYCQHSDTTWRNVIFANTIWPIPLTAIVLAIVISAFVIPAK